MANSGKTRVTGTVVEVRKKGETVWGKFVCNDGAIPIDYGTEKEIKKCLEDGTPIFGENEFSDVTFKYVWTQAMTNQADSTVKAAKEATNDADKIIEIRVTMNNATGDETTGTTYVIPFAVKGYKHQGESGGVWETETTWQQIGKPEETAAA